MKTSPQAILLVFVSSFLGSFGMVFLKAGAGRLERNLKSLLTNYWLMAGIATYVLSSVLYVIALKSGELSILYPMVSLGYIWALIWARIFFKEPLTPNKFVGLGMILIGIACIGAGSTH